MAKKNTEDTHINLLETTINTLNAKYGAGTVTNLDDRSQFEGKVIPTSSLGLNRILGVGGMPKGRIIEIWGPEACGKSSMALDCVANCQKQGGKVLFVDTEHALSIKWAQTLGVDIHNNFWISQPDFAEDAFDIIEQFVRTNEIDLIVLDSVAALLPKAEGEGEMEDQQIGLVARLMSKALRKLNGLVSKSNCTVIFINQLRSKINTFGFGGDGNVTTGGNALKYFASIRLEFKKVGQRKEGDQKVGDNIRITCVKNKVATPYLACEIPLIADEGFSTTTELIDELIVKGLAKKAGAWYNLQDSDGTVVEKFQGEKSFKTWFLNNPDQKVKYLKLIEDI